MQEARQERIRVLATKLAGLRMRHTQSQIINVANRTYDELVNIEVSNALLEAEINDTQLLLSLELLPSLKTKGQP